MRSSARAVAFLPFRRIGGKRQRWPRPGSAAATARRLLVASAAAVALPGAASALDFRTARDPSGRLVIHADGGIKRGDAARFRSLIAAAGSKTPHVFINSGGGLVGEAVQIATVINQVRIPVTAGDMCASACFFVFAASPYPTIGMFTRLGVHRAYERGAGETTASYDATLELARIAQNLSVPSAVVGRVMSTPGDPRSMYWLTEEDFRAMRVKFAFPPTALPPAAAAPAAIMAAGAAAMVEAGREDRLAHRSWLAGLSDREREGAAFAVKPRRRTGWLGCLSASLAFSAACRTAQAFWAKVDERSHDPNYRLGWEGP